MLHHLLTLACFGVAVALYVLGQGEHAALLVTGGFLAELIGWRRLLSRRNRKRGAWY